MESCVSPAEDHEWPVTETWVTKEENDNNHHHPPQPILESALDKNLENYLQEQKEWLEEEKVAIQDVCIWVNEEKQKLLAEEKMLEDLQQQQQATELLRAKYKAM